MMQSIGANLYGFAIGGPLLVLQLLLLGAFHYFTSPTEIELLSWVGWILIGGIAIFFILAILYLASSVFIVFPASLVLRAIPMPTWVAVGIGGIIGGITCWIVIREYAPFGGLHWALMVPCLSSAVVTGSVTAFVLHRVTNQLKNPDLY